MYPTTVTSNELSALTALGQRPHVKRPEDRALVLGAFEGVAREVAAILLDDPTASQASDEARDIAAAIQEWVATSRGRATQRAAFAG